MIGRIDGLRGLEGVSNPQEYDGPHQCRSCDGTGRREYCAGGEHGRHCPVPDARTNNPPSVKCSRCNGRGYR